MLIEFHNMVSSSQVKLTLVLISDFRVNTNTTGTNDYIWLQFMLTELSNMIALLFPSQDFLTLVLLLDFRADMKHNRHQVAAIKHHLFVWWNITIELCSTKEFWMAYINIFMTAQQIIKIGIQIFECMN